MIVELKTFGETQLRRDLLRWGDRVENPKGFFKELVRFLERHEKAQFDSEGGHASGGWQPLNEDYRARKVKAGLDSRILRATGALFDAMTSSSAPGAVRKITSDTLKFGADLGWPVSAHQKGNERLPQRRVVELTEQDRQAVVKGLQEWIRYGTTKQMAVRP